MGAKEEIRRLTAHTTKGGPQHAPASTLGSAFGSAGTSSFKMTFASAPATPRPVSEPIKAPEVQAVEPKAPAEEPVSEQLGARAAKPRTLSVFRDDSVKNYDKWTEGVTLGVKSKALSPPVTAAPAVQTTYVVNGVQIKTPVSTNRQKWESVEVCKPDQPRRLSRCWRRGRRRSSSCPKHMKPAAGG